MNLLERIKELGEIHGIYFIDVAAAVVYQILKA
jgi:hypothetical protein